MRRCRRFLDARAPAAAERAAREIARYFDLLKIRPEIGRPVGGEHPFRELVIGFGETGYLALYLHDADRDEVVVLAFRHQREADYKN